MFFALTFAPCVLCGPTVLRFILGSELSSLLPAVTAEVDAFHRLGQPHVSQQNHEQEHEVQRRQGLQLEVVRQRSHRQEDADGHDHRSEENTSELPSLMRISSAVFCLKKKKTLT